MIRHDNACPNKDLKRLMDQFEPDWFKNLAIWQYGNMAIWQADQRLLIKDWTCPQNQTL